MALKRTNRKRSASEGNLAVDCRDQDQGRLVRLLNSLQRKKERSIVRSVRGIFALGMINVMMGACAFFTEVITKIKYPNASAALLSIESAGMLVAFFAVLTGLLSILTGKTSISKSGHKPWVVKLLKSFANFTALCSFGAFGLSLCALSIYTTLHDLQHKVSPFLHFERRFVKLIDRDDLAFPMGYLEELVILKSCAMSFHLLVFLTSLFTVIFSLFNLYVNSMPNFGGCADVIKTVGADDHAICTEWVKTVNAQMKFQNRQIALLFDNAPSHPKNLKLSNVELIYLPLNLTSEVQPSHQDIIRTMKASYHKRLLTFLIARAGEWGTATEFIKSVSVMNGIQVNVFENIENTGFVEESSKAVQLAYVTSDDHLPCFERAYPTADDVLAAAAESNSEDEFLEVLEGPEKPQIQTTQELLDLVGQRLLNFTYANSPEALPLLFKLQTVFEQKKS
ncbi:hypothetical protein BV898_07265 [Hypsibius exemplaris]|uniref:DDE-1 domain-containing protein n=1 Tax=Hypsibius exemplaris TaxID=2072580 RepID=A0A1W0WTW0_HYPEX|nr:hypothetical protein BV898_07265 [Hypsibius exemplaris]